MATSRRNFLRQTGCLLGGAAIASTLEGFGLMSAYAQSDPGYRALVCIFLNGGNDSNNMVVPLDAEYSAYQTVRGPSTLAHTQASLLPVNPASGRQFGLHPNMPELQQLFNVDKKLAVVCNVGPLAEPLTRATYQNGTGKKPLQLFSHSDQVGLWQSSIADGVSQTGWGGRTADRIAYLNGAATFPQVISIAGISLFVTGNTARPLAVNDSRTSLSSVLPLNNAAGATTAETNARRASFDALRTYDLTPLLFKASSDLMTSTLQTSAALSSAPAQNFSNIPDTTLGYQLEQVARLIALRGALGIKRQIFFVSLGGFDTHSNQKVVVNGQPGGQDGLLLQVSQAMKAFYDTTVTLGVQDYVTTFTLSDFGRTFQPAGSGTGVVGSDHGWGNHQLVMGGAVRGGDFYGRFPTLALNTGDDADSRGRWIPTTSVEQYAATLGTWYGLLSGDLPLVFPLIGRFPSSNLGFMM